MYLQQEGVTGKCRKWDWELFSGVLEGGGGELLEKEAQDHPKIWRDAYKLNGWGRKEGKSYKHGWGVHRGGG